MSRRHPCSAFLHVAVPCAAMLPACLVIRIFFHFGLELSANFGLRHYRIDSTGLVYIGSGLSLHKEIFCGLQEFHASFML